MKILGAGPTTNPDAVRKVDLDTAIATVTAAATPRAFAFFCG